MLGGAIIPGKPVANMYFTMYGFNPVVQSLILLRDLKLVWHIIYCLSYPVLTYKFRVNTPNYLHE